MFQESSDEYQGRLYPPLGLQIHRKFRKDPNLERAAGKVRFPSDLHSPIWRLGPHMAREHFEMRN